MTIMPNFIGRHLRRGDDLYHVVGQDPDGSAYYLADERGSVITMSVSEFHEEIRRGNVTEGKSVDFSVFKPSTSQSEEMAFRRALLQKLAKLQADGWTWDRIMPELTKHFRQDPRFGYRAMDFPSKRTIQNWRAQLVDKGPRAMFDNRSNSGNRNSRHDAIFEEIVLDLLDRSFLKSDRYTVTALVQESSELYIKRCEALKRKPGPHGRKAVESIIATIPHSKVVKGRLGSKEAEKRLVQASLFQDIRRAFDRVEVDSTRANIFVTVEGVNEPVRPWITIAVDAATGFMVGLFVSMNPPTAITTATVLRESMVGPDEGFFDRFGIENGVFVFGMALTVVADQGPENSGDIIERLLLGSGVELQKNIPGKPQKKPFVERGIRTLKGFVSELPGTTQTREMPAKTRTEKAIAEARLSFDQFVHAVQRWRFDVYGKKVRRRVQSPLSVQESPTEAWQRLSREAFVLPPAPKAELDRMFFCQKVTRTLHHYGIEVGRIQYSSSELKYLYKDRQVREVDVWVNPTDIREIAVEYGFGGEFILVPSKDPDLPAISVEERDRIIAANKREPESHLSTHEILLAIMIGEHRKPITGKTNQVIADQRARQQLRDRELAKTVKPLETRIDLNGDMEPQIPMPRPRKTDIQITKKQTRNGTND